VEGKFDLLKVKDLKAKGKQGYPRLPVKVFTFELPENSVVLGVEIVKGNYVEIKNRLKIAPVPEPVKIGMKLPEKSIRLIPDKKVYSLNSLFPGKIVSYVVGKRKKEVVGAVYFYPVQYNPAEKKAYLIYSAQINLYYQVNGDDKKTEKTSSFNPGVECIIICPEKYLDAASILEDFHENMGTINPDPDMGTNVPTEIYTIEYINSLPYGEKDQPPLAAFPDNLCPEGGFTSTGVPNRDLIARNYNEKLAKKILSFILDLADAPGYDISQGDGYVSAPDLQYIVLLGNSQDIPPSYYVINTAGGITKGRYDSWIPTDFFYSLAPHNDLIPEFGVGRLPVVDLDGPVLYGTVTAISGLTITDNTISSDPGDLAGMTVVITDNASGGDKNATGRYLDIVSSSYNEGTHTLTLNLSSAAWTDNIEAGDRYKIIDLRDEAQFVVDKIINWYTNVDYSWFKNVALCGGNPFDDRFFWGELGCLDILNASDTGFDNRSYFSGMNVTKYFSTDEGYDESFKKSDVEPLLQHGADHGFVYLMGHGSGSAFYFDDYSSISSSDILSYSSTSDYHIPVVLSVACINGTFDAEIWNYGFNVSFGEGILLSPAGGIAYLGASRSALSEISYSVSSTNPGVISHYQSLMPEMNLLVFRRYHRGGNLLNTIFSKTLEDYYLLNADNWNTATFRTLIEFHLLGDPALYIPQQQWDSTDDYSLPDLEALDPRSVSPTNSYIFPVYEVPDTGEKEVEFSITSNSPSVEVKLVDVRYHKTDEGRSMSPQNYVTQFDAVDSGIDDPINGPSLYFLRVSNREMYTNNYSREKRIYIEVVNKFTPEGDILLIDDDELRCFVWDVYNDYENYYEEALQALGYVRVDQTGTLKYKVWHVENSDGLNAPGEGRHGEITPDVLNWYIGSGKSVIWFTGDDSETTFVGRDTEFVKDFLDSGGRFFVTGQDIGFDIGDTDFYKNCLHAIYVQDDIKLYNIDGIPNDALSDGLWNINITGGDGADNQNWPSEIDPNTGASICLLYNQAGAGSGSWESSGGAGIRYYDQASGGALVYFAFGFEAIDNLPNPLNGRKVVLQRVLNWLGSPTSTGIFTATPGDTIVTLHWTIPLGQDGVLIIRKEGSYTSGIPQNGTTYTVGDAFSDGGVIIYIGSGSSFIDTGLTNGTTYYYTCYSYQGTGSNITYALLGNAYATPTGGGGPGELPPPTNLTATASQIEGVWQIDLNWQDNSTDEDGFSIERKEGVSGTYSEIATVGANVKTYTDSNLTEGKTYYYRVRAFKGATYSDYSNEASATTSALLPPTNLTATAGVRQVFLRWKDNSYNEDGFIIERKHLSPSEPNPSFTQIAIVGPDENTYTDSNLWCDSRPYFYRVRAYNLSEQSDYTNEAWDTPSAFPASENPSNLEGLPGYNAVSVVWDDNTTSESYYYIELWATPPSDIANPDSEIVVGPYSGTGTVSEIVTVDNSVVSDNIVYIRVRTSHQTTGDYSLYAPAKDNPSMRYIKVEFFRENATTGGGGGGCFIATAAYGSYQEKHVWILRQFRDKYLLTNRTGRAFVRWYYKHSPKYASIIAKNRFLKFLTRIFLAPLYLFAYTFLKTNYLLLLFLFLLNTGIIFSIRLHSKLR